DRVHGSAPGRRGGTARRAGRYHAPRGVHRTGAGGTDGDRGAGREVRAVRPPALHLGGGLRTRRPRPAPPAGARRPASTGSHRSGDGMDVGLRPGAAELGPNRRTSALPRALETCGQTPPLWLPTAARPVTFAGTPGVARQAKAVRAEIAEFL